MGAQTSSDNVQYCYQMPNSKEPGFTPVYRNPRFKEKLTTTPDPNVRNFRDAIVRSCTQKFQNQKALGKILIKKIKKDDQEVEQRTIQYLTYKQCFQKAEMLGRAMIGHKLQFKEKTQGMKFIGIYSKNRVEWVLTDLACILFGLTSIPLYDTLGVENLSYCLNQTEMTTLFLTAETLKVLLGLKDHGKLKNLVLFDRIDEETVKKANKMGFSVLDFNALVEEGRKFPNIRYQDVQIEPNNIHTFSYTSGTTGPPKGAMLSHLNFTSFLSAVQNHDINFKPDDVYLSFLPLPHVMQRVIVAALFYTGASVVIYGGDINKIKDDCQVVRPTLFCAVPRLINRIVQKVQEGFESKTGPVKLLVDLAIKTKMENIQQKGQIQHGVFDSLVFEKVKQMFGGRIRLIVSGSAPLSKKNFQFMEMVMICPLFQGYGQTENTAAAFMRILSDKMTGHLGGVMSHLQFRLADIPEMKYTSQDKDQEGRPTPRGQIWLRGPGVIQGYYKLKDKTDEAITKDGWLKTGDVGLLFSESRRLKIIDRKKNIFKLQQGEYVAPEKIEILYSRCPYIEEVFLHGDSAQNFCVAVIKPRKENFMELAKKNNLNGSFQELCRNKEMKKALLRQVFNFGKAGGLNSFEQPKNIFLQTVPFVEKKILTNTLKLQRFEAKTVYKQTIAALYEEGEISFK